jgi:hypothetical protein
VIALMNPYEGVEAARGFPQGMAHCDGSYLSRFGSNDPDYGSLGDLTPQGTAYNLARVIRARGLPPNVYRA